ncbi:MAG: DegV family protein [Anaerolineales bacterium]|nr:DegV family protein [Anaerolineales bacterium]
MSHKVAIVTDSTAYLPQDLIDHYRIRVTPLVLIWGKEIFKDGIDILPTEFYHRLQNAKIIPTTSQPPVQNFKAIFTQLLNEDYDVLTILISDKLSGTLDSAYQAAKGLPEDRIRILDSYTTSMAMGFQVIMAARAAEDGKDLNECLKVAEETRDNTGVVFVVDTLEFLHRGGRIGGGARFLGTALKLKPILEVVGGRVEAVERVRTKNKAINRLLEIIEERTRGKSPVRLAGLHANAMEDAQVLLERAKKRTNAVETFFSKVSPVIGTHTGPGTIGLAYMTG